MPQSLTITNEVAQFGLTYDIGHVCWNSTRLDFSNLIKSPVSVGIEWEETRWEDMPKIPVSHTYGVTASDTTEEAFSNGVHPGTLSAYLNDPDVAVLVRRPKQWCLEMGKAIVAAVMIHDGEGYDYTEIVGQAIIQSGAGQLLDEITKGKFANVAAQLFANSHEEICSRLWAKGLMFYQAFLKRPDGVADLDLMATLPDFQKTGLFKKMTVEKITPEDLLYDMDIFEPGAVELFPAP